MRRLLLIWICAIALLGSLGAGVESRVQAQTDAPATPSTSGTPDSSAPSDTIWFVIVPEGKANGDYFDVEIEPGSSATLKATIGNGSEIPVKAIMYAADAYSGINGGFVLNNADIPVTDPTTWLDFPTETYEFDAQELTERTFTVTVPEGTAPGQYITGIAVETADAAPMKGEAPILVKYRLVAPVLVTVPGQVSPSFEITGISAEIDDQTTTITGAISNTGNIRVRPEGTVTFTDSSGEEVVNAQVAMKSVYAGDSTVFQILLPSPLPEGTYTSNADLVDPDTGTSAALSNADVYVAQTEAPAPLTITSFTVEPMPSADEVVFAQVTANFANIGAPVAGGEVTLTVLKDGVQVDEQVLASSLTLQNGETVVQQPYIPASGSWEAGTYTFEIELIAIDPASGTQSVIATALSDDSILIP